MEKYGANRIAELELKLQELDTLLKDEKNKKEVRYQTERQRVVDELKRLKANPEEK